MIEDDEPLPEPDETEGADPDRIDVGDPQGVAKRETKIARERREVADWWRAALASPVGRRALWKLLAEDFHAFETRFPCGPNGAPHGENTWFQAGIQSCGEHLYGHLMGIDVAAVLQMHVENDVQRFPPRVNRRKRGA